MKKRRNYIIGIIAIIILALFITGRMFKGADGMESGSTEKPIAIQAIQVSLGNIDGKLKYTGNVEGINEAVIISQTSGIIQKVYTDIGKQVGNGTVLVMIENEMQKAGVEQAKAQVLAAETNYEKAQKDLERIERLYKETVATKDNLELTQLNLKAALAQLKGAQAALKVAEKQLSDTYIKSTISGKIASKEVNLGGMVAPGTKIATIVDNSKIKIKSMISENDISKIKTGQDVKVKIDALPGKEFAGKVNTVGSSTQENGRSYQVEIIINNNDNGEIKSGMFARCEIKTDEKNGTILIPENSLITNNDGSTQVFVVENGRAILKSVKTGIKNDGYIEILSGITSNSKVVTTGKERLKDGILVSEK